MSPINYGIDGEQQNAIEVAIETMKLRIRQVEADKKFNKRQIQGKSVMKLENGRFYERHMQYIRESEGELSDLRKSIEELQKFLGSPVTQSN